MAHNVTRGKTKGGRKVERYTITGRSEECDCGYCGCPLSAYDRVCALMIDNDPIGQTFCSDRCADGGHAIEQR